MKTNHTLHRIQNTLSFSNRLIPTSESQQDEFIEKVGIFEVKRINNFQLFFLYDSIVCTCFFNLGISLIEYIIKKDMSPEREFNFIRTSPKSLLQLQAQKQQDLNTSLQTDQKIEKLDYPKEVDDSSAFSQNQCFLPYSPLPQPPQNYIDEEIGVKPDSSQILCTYQQRQKQKKNANQTDQDNLKEQAIPTLNIKSDQNDHSMQFKDRDKASQKSNQKILSESAPQFQFKEQIHSSQARSASKFKNLFQNMGRLLCSFTKGIQFKDEKVNGFLKKMRNSKTCNKKNFQRIIKDCQKFFLQQKINQETNLKNAIEKSRMNKKNKMTCVEQIPFFIAVIQKGELTENYIQNRV